MKRLALAVLLVALTGPACVWADALDLDLDADGKVTMAEIKAAETRGRLARMDVNRDGDITRQEFQAMLDFARQQGRDVPQARADRLFARLDADRDGVVSRAERDAAVARRFNLADANHDGWLSKSELLTMQKALQRAY